MPYQAKAQARQNEQVQLNSNNTIVLRDEISWGSVTSTMAKITAKVVKRSLNKYEYPLYLVLDSPGGDLEAGLAFIQYAKTVKNLHTITLFSASMASGIVEALPGRRMITDDGVLMFHRAKAGVEGQVETGELETRLANIKRLVRRMEQANADRLQIDLAEYKSRVVNEYWLDSNAAITDRAMDKIVDVVCSPELMESTTSVAVQTFFGAMSLSYSGCPLIRIPTSN